MLKRIIVLIVCLSLACSGCNDETSSSANGGNESASNAGATKPIEIVPLEVQPAFAVVEQLSRFVRRIFQDKSGNLWFGTNGDGVIRYDGSAFTNFQKEQGLASNAIQCTFEDREGRIWLGGWMGLFRYDGGSIFGVGKNGPWQ